MFSSYQVEPPSVSIFHPRVILPRASVPTPPWVSLLYPFQPIEVFLGQRPGHKVPNMVHKIRNKGQSACCSSCLLIQPRVLLLISRAHCWFMLGLHLEVLSHVSEVLVLSEFTDYISLLLMPV